MASRSRAQRREAAQNRLEAIRNPLRAEILELLVKGPNSPAEMAKILGASTQLVSQHTKRLVELGCAELADVVPVHGTVKHVYRATARVLVETKDWENLSPEVKNHQVWQYANAIVDDLELGLREKTLGRDKYFHLSQTRIVVDERGRDEVMEVQEQARLKILEIQAESTKRLDGEDGVDMSSLQGCFVLPLKSKR